ncbi:MAG: class I SAM-dependent methyltransferase [Acidobacteria bacterium]|nr:class I SAM-dependent methyltransferase [Acidobacteriota bacterium]
MKRYLIFEKARTLLEAMDYEPAERLRLSELMQLFAELPVPPDPIGLYPDYAALKDKFLRAVESGSGDVLEEAFLNLYCHVHGHEAPYLPEERLVVDKTEGYWCHAGGLSPILKAPDYIEPHFVSGEFGAGNGLQTLLIQILKPHKKTVMIEISSQMVECGKQLQYWLGIPSSRVEWIVSDVTAVPPEDMDFIYLYRPVKPTGRGREFYRQFSAHLARSKRKAVIFSIADCLGPFLPRRFKSFYFDGHLTCYRG